MRIILSRADSIGDVMLTLPMAGFLKSVIKNAHVIFLGREYTRAVVELCDQVDEFISIEALTKVNSKVATQTLKQFKSDIIVHVFPHLKIAKLAKSAGIPIRIGTSHRWYHFIYANTLINLGRKNSIYHESELNLQLLKTFIKDKPDQPLYKYVSFKKLDLPEKLIHNFWMHDKFNIILHPKSKGSAREWPLDNYLKLIHLLKDENVNFILTGTKEEGEQIKNKIKIPDHVKCCFGNLSLKELIALIQHSDGLVACSTGPLHIAAMNAVNTFGIYPPIKPMHPGRWAAIGEKVKIFVLEKSCDLCKKTNVCECINAIAAKSVSDQIKNVLK